MRSGDGLEALDDNMRRVASISCRMTQVMARWQRLGAGYARVMSRVTSVKVGRWRVAHWDGLGGWDGDFCLRPQAWSDAGEDAGAPGYSVGGRECWDG